MVSPLLYMLCECESNQRSLHEVSPSVRTSICSGVHVSRSTDLILLICVPMLRWMPEQRMHTNAPLRDRGDKTPSAGYVDTGLVDTYMFHDAHLASACHVCRKDREQGDRKLDDAPLRLQSAQRLFSSFLTSSRRMRACRSVVALSCLYILDT